MAAAVDRAPAMSAPRELLEFARYGLEAVADLLAPDTSTDYASPFGPMPPARENARAARLVATATAAILEAYNEPDDAP